MKQCVSRWSGRIKCAILLPCALQRVAIRVHLRSIAKNRFIAKWDPSTSAIGRHLKIARGKHIINPAHCYQRTTVRWSHAIIKWFPNERNDDFNHSGAIRLAVIFNLWGDQCDHRMEHDTQMRSIWYTVHGNLRNKNSKCDNTSRDVVNYLYVMNHHKTKRQRKISAS